MASEQTKAVIDAAFQAHVSDVFGRLCSSTEKDAEDRFVASWDRAVAMRDSVLRRIK